MRRYSLKIKNLSFSLLSLIIASCAASSKITKSDSPGAFPGKRINPVLQKHLSQITYSYDKKRFTRFFNKETEKPIKITKTKIESIITSGMRYLGRRYIFGRLDCSSFIYKSFRANDINFPYTAELQARYGKIISDRKQMKRGDLIYFTRTYRTAWFITHVAIYLGDNKMLHAASDIVKITDFPEPGYWWNKYFVFATRIIKEKKK